MEIIKNYKNFRKDQYETAEKPQQKSEIGQQSKSKEEEKPSQKSDNSSDQKSSAHVPDWEVY